MGNNALVDIMVNSIKLAKQVDFFFFFFFTMLPLIFERYPVNNSAVCFIKGPNHINFLQKKNNLVALI